MGDDPGFPAERYRLPDLFQGDPLSDPFEHFRVSRFHAETDAVAARLPHERQGLAIDGVDPGKGAPGKAERAPEDFVAHLSDLSAVGNKEIVGHVDPVDPVGEDLLDLVDDQRGGALADSLPHHPASQAEDTGIGAAAAGDDADRIAEGLIAGEREQMARGKRQGIEIFDERLGIRRDDPPVAAEGESPDLFPGRGIHLLRHQFGDGPLPLPAYDEIDLRVVHQCPGGVKGDVGAAHDGDQRGAMPLCRADDLGGAGEIERHRRGPDDMRAGTHRVAP